MPIHAVDHVQLAMPEGGEAVAAAFYVGVLGFEAVEKPEALRANGGCWFRAGRAELHLGVEADFRPARKAHPALRIAGIDRFAARCEGARHPVEWDERYPGVRRFYVHDPFGNRLELMESPARPDAAGHPAPDLAIRRISDDDREPLLALLRDLHPTDAEAPQERIDRVWLQLLESECVRVYVGSHEERLVASCTLVIAPNLTRGARPFGVIENVVTARRDRRRGFGGAMLRHALHDAWAEGCYKVMLLTGSTRPGTLHFYDNAGFVRDRKEGFVSFPPAG
jgi:GNAT superfamily N-acetyltransferase/catechol 2,3-dioxygenase-like lactoylglutathione lyase family enzyme